MTSLRALPDFPWDSLAPYKERASSCVLGLAWRSSTCPWARRSTRRRTSCRRRCAPPRTPRATRRPTARRRCARRWPRWFARRRGVPDLDPDGVLPTIGSQGARRVAADPAGARAPATSWASPGVAYPTYDVGARLAGATPQVVDGLAALGPLTPADDAKAVVAQQPQQPDRAGPRRRAPRQGRRLGAPARRRRGQRRVLRRARLAARLRARHRPADDAEHPRPAGLRRQPRGPARRLLAEQAVQPRRLPRRLRRRRRGARASSCSRCASTPA